MVLGTVVYLVCSVGVGGCGADGSGLDATRPQDLAIVKKYEKCFQEDKPGESSGEHVDRCSDAAGITKFISNPAGYKGRWVSLDGKPIKVNTGPVHDR
jgi:hypothetical protein